MNVFMGILIIGMIDAQVYSMPSKTKKQAAYKSSEGVTLSQRFSSLQHKKEAVFSTVYHDGKEYCLVPARLVGDKLTRYFTGTSAAVITMSCCPSIQVHRRCLQAMLHEDKNECPGCTKNVDTRVFAASRSNYIGSRLRNESCDYCHVTLESSTIKRK